MSMYKNSNSIWDDFKSILEKEYKGVNIAVYAIASFGLAAAVHKVRPVSKYSKASQIPQHFIKNHEVLNGVFNGVQYSPVRLLVNHKAPIYLPLWHSSKPPLPVKLWGVEIMSGHAVSWLECVAVGHKITFQPIERKNNELLSTVVLHLPKNKNEHERIDIAKALVELGYAKASLPKQLSKDSVESQIAPAILSAESKARSIRNGIWSEILPPLPLYIIYWRKCTTLLAEVVVTTTRNLSLFLLLLLQMSLKGVKKLALLPFSKRTPSTV